MRRQMHAFVLLLLVIGLIMAIGISLSHAGKPDKNAIPAKNDKQPTTQGTHFEQTQKENEKSISTIERSKEKSKEVNTSIVDNYQNDQELYNKMIEGDERIKKTDKIIKELQDNLNEKNINRKSSYILFIPSILLFIMVVGVAFITYKNFLRMKRYDSRLDGVENIMAADKNRLQITDQNDSTNMLERINNHKKTIDYLRVGIIEIKGIVDDLCRRTEQLEKVIGSPSFGPFDAVSNAGQYLKGSGAMRESVIEVLEAPDENIRRMLTGIVEQVAGSAAPLVPAPTAAEVLRVVVDSERRLLEDNWVGLYDEGDMYKHISDAVIDHHPHLELIEAVRKLAVSLKDMERLGPLADEVAEPLFRYWKACGHLRKIRELRSRSPESQSLGFLDELKKANLFLGTLRFSDHAREVLRLDIPGWTADHFPRLADAFYREYQLAQRREGTVSKPMEDARSLVDTVLSSAKLRVLKILLGRTQFDDRLHMARSTSSDMSMPNGTIAGVIRNGLEKSEGDWVLKRQAEVIVNRI